MSEKRRPCGKCGKNRAERFFNGSKGRVCLTCQRERARRNSRLAHQSRTFGLTADEYGALLSAQGGRCAICLGARRSYDTDHDHKLAASGLSVRLTIRGLLCARCNRRLLTAALDDPAVLRRAADYLEDPPARAVLRGRVEGDPT